MLTKKLKIILVAVLAFLSIAGLTTALVLTLPNAVPVADAASVDYSYPMVASGTQAHSSAFSSSTHGGTHTGGTVLAAGTGTLNAGGKYYLTGDLQLTTNLTVNGTVTLCLNGFKLTGLASTANTGSTIITLNEGATLNIVDCCPGKSCGKTAHQHKYSYSGAVDASYDLTGSGNGIIYGGVITGGVSGTYEYSSASLENRYWRRGGAIYGSTGSTINMYGGVISGNRAYVYITPSYYYGSAAFASGGGVYTLGKFNMYGGAIAGNAAYAYSNNTGNNKRGYGHGEGGAIYADGGTVNITGGAICNNTSNGAGATSSYGVGYGGAIYASSCDVSISNNVAIYGNSALSTGGAIYSDGANVSLKSASVYDNTAGTNGAAIYSASDIKCTLTDTKFNDNSSSGFVLYGLFDLTRCEINGNTKGGGINASSGTVINNTDIHDNQGAGIQTTGGITVDTSKIRNHSSYGVYMYLSGAVTFTDTLIEGNQKTAVYIYSANSYNDYPLEMKGCRILNNSTSGDGGAIYKSDWYKSVILKGCTFSGNSATGDGGALYLMYSYYGTASTAKLTIDDETVFSKNTAGGNGGGLYAGMLSKSSYSIGGQYDNNTAKEGSAIYLNTTTSDTTGSVSAVATDNNATNTNGSAIYITGSTSTVYLSGGVSGNKAPGTAYGVHLARTTTTTIKSGTTFKASNSKVGIYVPTGTLTMYGGTFTGNEVGLYVKSTVTTYTSSNISFSGNDKGIYVESGSVTIPNVSFTQNTVGVFVAGGSVTSSGSTFTSDTTAVKFGGTGTFTMSGGSINGSTCGVDLAVPGATFKMTSGQISGCTKGVNVVLGSKFNVSNTPVVANNTSSNVYLNSGARVSVTGYLYDGANICVTLEDKTGVVTSGFSSYGTTRVVYYHSDEGFNVRYDDTDSNEVEFYTGHYHGTQNFAELSSLTTLIKGHYSLVEDLSVNLVINGDVELCLNGYTLTGSGNAAITVNTGATLTICDCTGNGTVKGATNGVLVDGGALVLDSGTVTGNTTAVNVASGSFVMDGGSVNGASNGVNLASGMFILSGGTITSNNTGVYVANGTFQMTGGSVSGNSCGVNVAGGSFVAFGGTLNSVITGANTTLGGSVQVTGNGGGAGVTVNSGVTTICGGTISGNTGVSVTDGVLIMSAGSVTGSVYGVHLVGGIFTLTDGTVSGGTSAVFEDGGVYVKTGGAAA